MLTRDLARLAPRMDLWRLLHFYHSGLGYFVTARMMMLGIYCQVRCEPYCTVLSTCTGCTLSCNADVTLSRLSV